MSEFSKNLVSGMERDVLSLLREQRDLCRQVDRFANTQRSLITGDEPERLLSVLSERQRLLDDLGVIGERLRPYQKRWAQVRADLSMAEASEAEELIAEVNLLLGSILKTDEVDAQLLSARKNATAQMIQQVGQSRQVGAAYTATVAAPASGGEWSDE